MKFEIHTFIEKKEAIKHFYQECNVTLNNFNKIISV